MEVLIDTSIYRNDPKRAKNAFRALMRLCKGKMVRLHVPEWVKREFVSKQKQLLEEDFKKAQDAAESVTRRSLHPKLEDQAKKIQDEARAGFDMAAAAAEQEFEEWLKEAAAIEHGMTFKHAQQMADDYFNGVPPFSKVKHRPDIPDSLIFQVILELSSKVSELYVVANDGALISASRRLPNVHAFSDLESFIDTPDVQNALKNLPSAPAVANLMRAYKILPKLKESLEDMLETDIVEALASQTVFSQELPSDDFRATIMSVGSPHRIAFSFDQVMYYGGSEISIPFTAWVECELSYSISKAKFHTLSEWRTDRIGKGELNDYYYEADELFMLDVVGALSVEIPVDVLENANATDQDIEASITDGDHRAEIIEKKVIPQSDYGP